MLMEVFWKLSFRSKDMLDESRSSDGFCQFDVSSSASQRQKHIIKQKHSYDWREPGFLVPIYNSFSIEAK